MPKLKASPLVAQLRRKRKGNNWGGARPGAGRKPGPGGKRPAPRTDKDAFYDYARSCSPVAIDRLVEIIKRGKNEATAVQAAQVLLDRAWGKPSQAIDLEARTHHQVDIETKAQDPRTLAMALLAVLRDVAVEDLDEASDDVTLPVPQAREKIATPVVIAADPSQDVGAWRGRRLGGETDPDSDIEWSSAFSRDNPGY